MGIQFRNNNSNDAQNNNFHSSNDSVFPSDENKKRADELAAKEALIKKQEELRMRALAFEQRDAAKRQREQKMREEEEIRNNPQLAAERERRLTAAQLEEERRARFRAEEEAKIKEERQVEEKRMDQTEALIAAIRAQVEKEKAAKAAKEAANRQAEAENGGLSNSDSKPQFRTISPEEMEKLQERKRMKAAGIQPKPENSFSSQEEKTTIPFNGVSGAKAGLGDGPTLSNPNAGKESLKDFGLNGNGLGIKIADEKQKSDAEESTVALDVNAINVALKNSKGDTAGNTAIGSTIIVDDGSNAWGTNEKEESSWTESSVEPEHVREAYSAKDNFVDENGDIISVIPVRKKPAEQNDVYSAYNIDFDEEDDDFGIFTSSNVTEKEEEEAKQKAEEEARRRAEEEARRKAEEEARRKAEEEARRKAEEEARRKAEEEARRKAEEEARRKAEEEARRKAEEEARRKAEEEARRKAEEEARRKAEEEARRKAEEEARRKAEEEARRKAEEEARRRAEEEARRKAEEEARRKAEEEARRKAEEERKRIERENLIKAEEEVRRKAEEDAIKYRKLAEEAARQAEEAMKALEAVRKSTSFEAAKQEEKGTESTIEKKQRTEFTLPVGADQYLGKYLSVNAINEQISQAMQYIIENPSEPRNIVILGQYGFGTTSIAEDFARSFYAMGICKNKTIAKIKAGALNRANISDAISKLQGGCLVIENAGVISKDKLNEIYQIVNNPDNDVIIILTGQIETLSRIFKDNVVISSQFKHLIQVHRITDLDVFAIAKNHAEKLEYPCEPDAENMLRKRMREVESGNLDRVLKIVDNAVSKAHNREMNTGEQEHHLISSDFE